MQPILFLGKLNPNGNQKWQPKMATNNGNQKWQPNHQPDEILVVSIVVQFLLHILEWNHVEPCYEAVEHVDDPPSRPSSVATSVATMWGPQ